MRQKNILYIFYDIAVFLSNLGFNLCTIKVAIVFFCIHSFDATIYQCNQEQQTAFWRIHFSALLLPISLASYLTRASSSASLNGSGSNMPFTYCIFRILKLTENNAVTPAKLCEAGSLAEKQLNNKSFEIFREQYSFHDNVLSSPFEMFWPITNTLDFSCNRIGSLQFQF